MAMLELLIPVAIALGAYGLHHSKPDNVRERARRAMSAANERAARGRFRPFLMGIGIGEVLCDTGRIQAYFEDGRYRLIWLGGRGHPDARLELVERREGAFRRRLQAWMSPGFLYRGMPEAHERGLMI